MILHLLDSQPNGHPTDFTWCGNKLILILYRDGLSKMADTLLRQSWIDCRHTASDQLPSLRRNSSIQSTHIIQSNKNLRLQDRCTTNLQMDGSHKLQTIGSNVSLTQMCSTDDDVNLRNSGQTMLENGDACQSENIQVQAGLKQTLRGTCTYTRYTEESWCDGVAWTSTIFWQFNARKQCSQQRNIISSAGRCMQLWTCAKASTSNQVFLDFILIAVSSLSWGTEFATKAGATPCSMPDNNKHTCR